MTDTLDRLRLLKYYTLFGFFVIGVATVLLGQVLPILSVRLGLNDAESGTLFLAQFGGSLMGTLFAVRHAKRHGFVVTTLVGLIFMIAGLPGLNFSSFAFCWGAIFVYGVGLGLTIPAINLLTIETTPVAQQSSSINLINFAWGVGAICSQPFVALVSRGDSLAAITIILDIVLSILALCFLSASRNLTDQIADQPSPGLAPTIWQTPSSWLFVVFGFFVIGIESGLGGWLTTYSASIANGAPAINLTVLFFAFLVFGRAIAAVISRQVSESALIWICSVTLTIGIFLIVFGEGEAMVGAAVAGLGTSAIFPTNMVRFTRVFGPNATRNATPLFISGICGAASLSWLTGLVSTEYGSLRIGIVVLLTSALMVLILQTAIVVVHRKALSAAISGSV
ncbi:MAG: MFS transporter [Acidobacteriota bacterium]